MPPIILVPVVSLHQTRRTDVLSKRSPAEEPNPSLRRNHVYCYDNFKNRVETWSSIRAFLLKNAPKPIVRRVQPSRTVKVKPDHVSKTTPRKKVERRLEIESYEEFQKTDYTLTDPPGHEGPEPGDIYGTVMQAVEQEVERQLQRARNECEHHTVHEEKLRQACSVVDLPMGCTELKWCLHGLDKAQQRKRITEEGSGVRPVEEAEMLPSPSLGTWMLGNADQREMQELGETIEMCGLSFRVDLCNGWVKIVMV